VAKDEYVAFRLENPVQATMVKDELHEREIPHVIVDHHDTALDGLFQSNWGWGRLEVPEEYGEEVAEVLRDLKSEQ
jgi:hypothetical protein